MNYQTLNLLFKCNKEFSHTRIRKMDFSDTECILRHAAAFRDRIFETTPFKEIYSYMKYTNEPSAQTAEAFGCRFV